MLISAGVFGLLHLKSSSRFASEELPPEVPIAESASP
jgi:hypothetical protein